MTSVENPLHDYFSFGNSLILKTRELILTLWNQNAFSSSLKEDKTPVSTVDLRCEELTRELIRKRYPDHGIIGEEFGEENAEAEYVWTIDPIDGTQNLINRIPTFGTILALLHNGKPVLGWIDHPVLGLCISGGASIGVFENSKKIVLDDITTESLTPNDVIATNCPATFDRGGHLPVLHKILAFHPHLRIYYDVYAHSLAITGSLACMVEYNLKIWDLAATQALVEAAGGTYLELGRSTDSSKPRQYHAAFGKKRAVALLAKALLKT